MLKSLRFKIIAPLLLGMTALTLILSVYTYFSARHATGDSIQQIAEAQTNRAVSAMNLIFRSLISNATNIVQDQHVTSLFANPDNQLNKFRATEWLQIYVQSNDYLRDISVLDLDGNCIVSNNPGEVGKNYLDLAFVRNAAQGLLNFGESSVGLVTKKLSTVIASPIDLDGFVVGVLVLSCDLPQFVDYSATSSGTAQEISTSILNSEGRFVTHVNPDLVTSQTAAYPELYAELSPVGRNGSMVEYELEGQKYIGYAMLENSSRWLVISSGLENVVFAPAYRTGAIVLVISLSILALVSLIVILVSNGIVNSMLSLINYAKLVADGNLNEQIQAPARSDELGDLQISLKKMVQSLQIMLEKSEEGSRMKGEFLANMSHEIRTPLNAIIGLAYLSLRDTDISDKQKGNLEQIQVAAKTLLGVINDILDISKIESGKLALDEAKFNLRETLEQAVGIQEISARAKGLSLDMEYDPMLPDRFVGDSVRIGQIVNNLLSNAVKFTSHGGVKLRVSAVGGMDEQGRMQMRISVIDTGIGISRKALDSLFQPFTQADSSITRKYGGTGLGLAISDRLVHLMNGVFSVDSEPDQGSTFSFSIKLPVDKDDYDGLDRLGQGDAFSQLNLTGKSILIVEDNQLNQMILEELITPSRATIVTADNGLEAVEAMGKKRFDLIFMDMQMPIMDGLKATEIIRRDYSREQLPIIAVTANAMKEDMEKGLALGMNDYLTKPIEPVHLAELLYKWLGGHPDKA